jgi:hypothetical protein
MGCLAKKEEAVEQLMEDRISLIQIFAGKGENGTVLEELPAKFISEQCFELCASPGLALGAAKGDLIKLSSKGNFEVIKHGGNFCIQIYKNNLTNKEIKKIEKLVQKELNGTIDGTNNGSMAFSIPIKNGFKKTNKIFNEIREILDSEYFYSNIYRYPYDLDNQELIKWAEEIE